jgi:hypothetical protein
MAQAVTVRSHALKLGATVTLRLVAAPARPQLSSQWAGKIRIRAAAAASRESRPTATAAQESDPGANISGPQHGRLQRPGGRGSG